MNLRVLAYCEIISDSFKSKNTRQSCQDPQQSYFYDKFWKLLAIAWDYSGAGVLGENVEVFQR